MRFVKYWGPTLAWMGIIFYFSSRARVEVSDIFALQFLIFKSLHVIEYGILYILLYRSIKNTFFYTKSELIYLAWLFTIAYGMTDEIHQVFIPSREGRMRDIVIDAIGATFAAFYIWKYLPTVQRKLKIWVKRLDLL